MMWLLVFFMVKLEVELIGLWGSSVVICGDGMTKHVELID